MPRAMPLTAPLIVEETFDPSSPRFTKCPYDAYAAAREIMPVACHRDFGEWIVTGSREIEEILHDHANFTSRYNLEGSYPFTQECMEWLDRSLFFDNAIYNVDPPLHTRFRALVGRYFSPRSLSRLEPFIWATARELAAGLAGAGGGDIVPEFASVLPLRVTYHMIGIPEPDQAAVKQWNDAWLALQVVPLAPEQQVSCAQALIAYEAYLRELLTKRIGDPAGDLSTGLAHATVGSEPLCTLEQAVVATRFMIASGHETTSGLIGNAVHRLLEDRGRWEAVVLDPALAAAAVEETLRFDSPAQGALRVATQRVRVGDVDLPAGSRLRVMLAAEGRDPGKVEDPDTFRLDRRAPGHIGFGAGIHHCAGAALARLEARIALQALAEALPALRLEPGFEPRYQPGALIFHSLTALRVRAC